MQQHSIEHNRHIHTSAEKTNKQQQPKKDKVSLSQIKSNYQQNGRKTYTVHFPMLKHTVTVTEETREREKSVNFSWCRYSLHVYVVGWCHSVCICFGFRCCVPMPIHTYMHRIRIYCVIWLFVCISLNLDGLIKCTLSETDRRASSKIQTGQHIKNYLNNKNKCCCTDIVWSRLKWW